MQSLSGVINAGIAGSSIAQLCVPIASFSSSCLPRIFTARTKTKRCPRYSIQDDLLCLDSFFQAVRNCSQFTSSDAKKAALSAARVFQSTCSGTNSKYKSAHPVRVDAQSMLLLRKLQEGWRTLPTDRTFKSRAGRSTGIGRDRGKSGVVDVSPSTAFDFIDGLFSNKESKRSTKPHSSVDVDDPTVQVKVLKDQLTNEPNKRLVNILDEAKSESERGRILSATVEGFRAATNPKNGKSKSWYHTLMQFLTFVVIAYIGVMILQKSGAFPALGDYSIFQEISPESINVSFYDVKGCDEAKHELQDIVEYLRNPEKFTSLGGKLPKGVLLVGDPGTGKTLLARAVACEAGVPFFYAAGSEFDEIFVGMGGKRVRQLFKAAKMSAPSVIFIDEIDSVGGKRKQLEVNGRFANQTINQLLAEMDGFRTNEGVIVLGATNRREDLDVALTRPGRFDVEVYVHRPDLKGRRDILQLYMDKLKTAKEVDIEVIASRTVGFTGADLENLVNQAALKAALDDFHEVNVDHFLYALDKVLMGPEKKSKIPDRHTNFNTAIHEGGHTIVAHYTKGAHPLHKVTIVQRGAALGHTAFSPEKDEYGQTKEQLLALMDVSMGGRAAEELEFGMNKVTTGAADDLKKATSIATAMVKDLGMSEKVGIRTFPETQSRITIGDIGPETSDAIDAEIKRLLNESYERAKNVLKQHRAEHKALADALLKYETLGKDEIEVIVQGKNIDDYKREKEDEKY